MNKEKIDPNGKIAIWVSHHPLFRTQVAIDAGVERNLIFKTWGGIGDQICAEPTLRFALKNFNDCQVSLASELPGVFKHLNFKRVFDLNDEFPNYSKYLTFETIQAPDQSNMVWLFFCHMLTNCVDFPSLCALRCQLPINEKDIRVVGDTPTNIPMSLIAPIIGGVIVHPGKHWQSKTFPKSFWDRVLAGLKIRGIKPIIIGADADENRGTVDVDTEGCLDFRNKLSITESIWACQRASVVLTNDSAPLHMAAGGQAWIGFVATCKHPDFITHWRRPAGHSANVWQWREKNFGKGGIWDVVDNCPNKDRNIEAEYVPPELLASWLPEPAEMAEWAASRMEIR